VIVGSHGHGRINVELCKLRDKRHYPFDLLRQP